MGDILCAELGGYIDAAHVLVKVVESNVNGSEHFHETLFERSAYLPQALDNIFKTTTTCAMHNEFICGSPFVFAFVHI